MRGDRDLEGFLLRLMLRASAWALVIGIVFAVLVGLPIYFFHIPGRVVADLLASLFR